PERIFGHLKNSSRALVAHYFFPADSNPMIELVPSIHTRPDLVRTLAGFYEQIGKIPVVVKSAYGYAVDPVFEGLCQVAICGLEKGEGTVKEIDAVAEEVLGLGVGPFKALNLTGGNPITAHGLDIMGERLLPWFKTPALLHRMVDTKKAWETSKRDERIDIDPSIAARLADRFLGAYFALTSFIIDTGIIGLDDLNLACEVALVMNAPFKMMNDIGLDRALILVEKFCAENPGFPIPDSIRHARLQGGWKLSDLQVGQDGQTCVITIRRPKVLNALNLEVLEQIRDVLREVENRADVNSVVITGQGSKAFVSGADLNMISSLKTPEDGVRNSQRFQSVLNDIAHYSKPVVCALNGIAFGGGNELALACTARIAVKNLPVLFCQPEVKLGFIPGGGATQRLPRLIGMEKATEILRTGRTVSGAEALEIGYLDRESQGDLVEDACTLAGDILAGDYTPKRLEERPLNGTPDMKPVEIGNLSRRIDRLLLDCIRIGWTKPLKDALCAESEIFGECMKTKDMYIGLDNFKTNGPKVAANFIHE
ncbi:MAG TPA: enoyl-CoA hydratase-related protein, partial [Saprospiraceae bacterium]|nr:enoyl-CoA hydratase-related protein [Saprospiraceae bacterium]